MLLETGVIVAAVVAVYSYAKKIKLSSKIKTEIENIETKFASVESVAKADFSKALADIKKYL